MWHNLIKLMNPHYISSIEDIAQDHLLFNELKTDKVLTSQTHQTTTPSSSSRAVQYHTSANGVEELTHGLLTKRLALPSEFGSYCTVPNIGRDQV